VRYHVAAVVMRVAAARVVVLMGRQPQTAFLGEYERLAPVALSGPVELEGRRRILLQVPHPNARLDGPTVPLSLRVSWRQREPTCEAPEPSVRPSTFTSRHRERGSDGPSWDSPSGGKAGFHTGHCP
jgi:hypothetical protein